MKSIPSLQLFVALYLTAIRLAFCVPLRGDSRANPWAPNFGPQVDESGPEFSYIAILKESESRPWEEILVDMGWDTKILESAPSASTASYHHFKTPSGRRITAAGDDSLRVLIMNMTEIESERIKSLEYVEMVEKGAKLKLPKEPPAPAARDGDAGPATALTPPKAVPLPRCRSAGFTADPPFIEQCGAPWGLQRISTREKVEDRPVQDPFQPYVLVFPISEEMTFSYKYHENAGRGADVYIIDTGLNPEHEDFEGRAQRYIWTDEGGEDFNGHGTWVAGIAGSKTFGVAKAANIFGVPGGIPGSRDGDLDMASIMASFAAIISSHNRRMKGPNFAGSVINMSFGFDSDAEPSYFTWGMKSLVRAGIHIATSAGNDDRDACNNYPSSYTKILPVFSVGASNMIDRRADFSNWGPCVDIYAPGENIIATGFKEARFIGDGTSAAAPFVAGMIAYELSLSSEFKLDPAGMKKYILGKALRGMIDVGKDPKEAKDLLGGEKAPEILLLNNGVPDQSRHLPQLSG
ncbi:serine protease [Arthrobotrys megalospora]